MVGGARGTVRLEIVPWLTEEFGQRGTGRLVLEEPIEGPMRLGDYLASLAGRHPAIGAALVDLDARELFEHVNVVLNDVLVGSHAVLDEPVQAGDSVVFLPAFSGG